MHYPLTSLASDAALREAVAQNIPIHPQMYDHSQAVSMKIVTDLTALFVTCAPANYALASATFSYFRDHHRGGNSGFTHPKSDSTKHPRREDMLTPKTPSPQQSPEKKSRGNQDGGPSRIVSPSGNTGETPLKDRGFLLYKGEDGKQFPLPNDVFLPTDPTKPNGPQANPCFKYVCIGLQCKFGKRCNFLHINNLADCPQAGQAKIKKWVNETPDLRFANGQNNRGMRN
jgi:hypothetical protein